jgi:SnoaL-like domain
MTPVDILLVTSQIEALNAQYWLEVDRRHGAHAHEYFVEDGIYTTTARSRRGRAEIAEFYSSRRELGPRTSRHVVANHHVVVQDAHHAQADWILLLHAADGSAVLPSEPAILIADVHDVCMLCDDQRWRYVSRSIAAVFKSSTPTTG